MAVGGTVTIIVPPMSGGEGVIPGPDYSAELTALAGSLEAMKAEIVIINREIGALTTALTAMFTQMELLNVYLLAVQSPTGDFRTVSPEDIASGAIVTSALAKNVPPIVPAGGVTS